MEDQIKKAADILRKSTCAIAFTGAGVSYESGIPTFRGGADSIWNRYDQNDIEIDHFMSNPSKSWNTIRECFYSFMEKKDIRPNKAHYVLARLEKSGLLKAVVTQNIDGLHQAAGSEHVIELHGTTKTLSCIQCHHKMQSSEIDMKADVPTCPICGGIVKPDFVFFGEQLPENDLDESFSLAEKSDVCIIVGTSGVVMPAAMVPAKVKQHGGKIIEISPENTKWTDYADVHIHLGAVNAFTRLENEMFS